jgi:hypothetical protein
VAFIYTIFKLVISLLSDAPTGAILIWDFCLISVLLAESLLFFYTFTTFYLRTTGVKGMLLILFINWTLSLTAVIKAKVEDRWWQAAGIAWAVQSADVLCTRYWFQIKGLNDNQHESNEN